ncbi:MAG: AAA family ATPase [Ktedonobacteraceae bacterium]|nr:AAA family ATPase [Ktedonobacteraceae bacterium]
MSESFQKGLSFPQIRKVKLYCFSLYSLERTITILFEKGVLCLVGANGLGKSTFLNSINFALTGIVPNPDKSFASAEEFYRHNQNFAEEYFRGRIAERDHDAAEITIDFDLNDKRYSLTRGLFEPNQLRHFSRATSNSKSANIYKDMTPGQLHTEYINLMTNDLGMASFDQFVFLQFFVFTFDERHELLFWNNKVLEQALYLAFGIDPTQAKQASELRRTSEKQDSLARNFNWQANETRKKIIDLQHEAENISYESQLFSKDIMIEFERLNKQQEAQQEKVVFLRDALENSNTQLLRTSSQLALLRKQYEQVFQSHLYMSRAPLHHPILIESMQSSICGICGTEDEYVATSIRSKVDHRECPLCGTHIRDEAQPPNIEELKDLDAKIEKLRVENEEYVDSVSRLSEELKSADETLSKTNEEVNEFEFANRTFLSRLQHDKVPQDGITAILESYQHQFKDLMDKKEAAYKHRDQKRRELAKLQKNLEGSYVDAETKFVPMFKDLAYRFLGIDLDIIIRTTYPNPNVTLVLEVKGTERKQQFQLSESQKFFVDIALRMALARYISTAISKATLCIDTPEGSLDIAYESRAGEMFAIFIENGHNIIMTANINSSRLVRQLAARCGEERMKVTRMTEWTELSTVQIQEENLFEDAYKKIETSLHERIVS